MISAVRRRAPREKNIMPSPRSLQRSEQSAHSTYRRRERIYRLLIGVFVVWNIAMTYQLFANKDMLLRGMFFDGSDEPPEAGRSDPRRPEAAQGGPRRPEPAQGPSLGSRMLAGTCCGAGVYDCGCWGALRASVLTTPRGRRSPGTGRERRTPGQG